jgi:hypothetical protein
MVKIVRLPGNFRLLTGVEKGKVLSVRVRRLKLHQLEKLSKTANPYNSVR